MAQEGRDTGVKAGVGCRAGWVEEGAGRLSLPGINTGPDQVERIHIRSYTSS